MKKTKLYIALLAASTFASVLTVEANLTGNVYQNQGGSGNTDVAPTGSSSATFTMAGLPLTFDSRNDSVNGYTVGGWLATGGVTSGILYANSGVSGATMDNVTVVLTGTLNVFTGEMFTTAQDDGLTVTINGTTYLDNPGPHSPTPGSFTYTGPSGSESVNIEYSEIDGPPAVLDIAAVVPEPTTVIAGSLLLLPFGLSTLRVLRNRKQVA